MIFKKCECGSDIFYMRQYISGFGSFLIKSDGTEADNEDLHTYLKYRDTRKYYEYLRRWPSIHGLWQD